jgi:AraC-like DNA-binding protein
MTPSTSDHPTAREQTSGPYRERPPHPALARYLVCAWLRSSPDGASEHVARVVPDGCIDVVWFGDGQLTIAGPDTQPVLSPLPAGAAVAGVRFRPGMAPSLLGVPASALLDLRVALEEVWGDDARRLADRHERLASAGARLAALEEALVARLPNARPADERVQAAIAQLTRSPTTDVSALSRTLGVSERQLLRQFTAAVGYGPKTLGRVLRFQRVRMLAERMLPDGLSLAWLALEAGYADQAHMTREVTRLAGLPPGALLASGGAVAMSDSFKTVEGPPRYARR